MDHVDMTTLFSPSGFVRGDLVRVEGTISSVDFILTVAYFLS